MEKSLAKPMQDNLRCTRSKQHRLEFSRNFFVNNNLRSPRYDLFALERSLNRSRSSSAAAEDRANVAGT